MRALAKWWLNPTVSSETDADGGYVHTPGDDSVESDAAEAPEAAVDAERPATDAEAAVDAPRATDDEPAEPAADGFGRRGGR